ncbi:YiiG family protein [Acinetobacter sp. WU_MDCI_Axc73]|nr:YiiG family protein [Acinetobacter sp. WU_MDCI_Axc73]
MNFNSLILSATISSILLVGCGNRNNQENNQVNDSAEVSSSPSTSLNEYVEISNQLMGTYGLEQARNSYFKQNISNAKPSQALSYPSLNYKYLNEKFASLKDIGGLSPELNTAVQDLKQKIGVLESDYNEFNLYYDSGEYKTDQLVKGKAADAEIKTHFNEAMDSFEKFQSALDKVYKKQKQAELEKLKATGNTYIYHRAAALDAGERLVSVFQSDTDLNNPEKIKQADAIANELQTELNALNVEYNKNKDKDPSIGTDTVLLNLTSCLKYYRQFRESKNQSDYKFMVDGYNSAVTSANR